jgi:hypothetical protein
MLYASVSKYFLFDCKRFLFQRVFFICVSVLPDVNDMHITVYFSFFHLSLYLLKPNLKLFKAFFVGVYCMNLYVIGIFNLIFHPFTTFYKHLSFAF